MRITGEKGNGTCSFRLQKGREGTQNRKNVINSIYAYNYLDFPGVAEILRCASDFVFYACLTSL